MIIGLYGIQGVYNFGCEAIVRGAYKFINDVFIDCKIVYFSYSYEYDKKVLSDLDIEIIPIVYKNSITRRIINKLLKILKVNKRTFLFDAKAVVQSVDLFVSIGGDIYTIPRVLREQKKYPYYNPLIDFFEYAIKLGKQVVVYGASVGPWGNYEPAVQYNINALKKYKAILCREEASVSYLQGVGLNNVWFFPDPAFLVKSNLGKKDIQKKYIGINMSPLSFNEVYGSYDDSQVGEMADLLDKIFETYKVPLLFIPHVLSKSENDNDYIFLQRIKERMKNGNSVIFSNMENGFMGVKTQLSECYFVVASRMHCAINSIDENIPAVFICYSQKSKGMCKYIYGNEQMCVDIKSVNAELFGVLDIVFKGYNELSMVIQKRNDEIEKQYKLGLEHIRVLLNGEKRG